MPRIYYRAADIAGLKISPIAKPARQTVRHCSCCTCFRPPGHMFRDLIPLLADSFHLVAPDLPGFGQSDLPPRDTFKYTFENLAETIDPFTDNIG